MATPVSEVVRIEFEEGDIEGLGVHAYHGRVVLSVYHDGDAPLIQGFLTAAEANAVATALRKSAKQARAFKRS
jgi:hypothetical protein